jgi:uncharacterized protein
VNERGAIGALQRAMAAACLSAGTDLAIERDLGAFLAGHGVSAEDAEAILRAPRRLAVYRSLVRNGLSTVVLRILPATRARMNAACAGRFDVDLETFVDLVGPRTHYLRDVPSELFAWAEPRWRGDPQVPAYLSDLARWELARFSITSSEPAHGPLAEGDAVTGVTAERSLVFAESIHLTRFGWAVHELSREPDATELPARRDVRLLAYRDGAHAVRWLELTPMAGSLVERLASGNPLGEAVTDACAEHETTADRVIPDVARLLADLAERGVILGAR